LSINQHFFKGLNIRLVAWSGRRAGGYSHPHHWPEEKKKEEGKNALLAHLRGLFAAIGVFNDF